MDFSNWTPEYYKGNENKCLNILKAEENWLSIPFLNYAKLEELNDSCLVRFRGVIQDMYNPEFYLENYEVLSNENCDVKRVQNGKYRDIPVLKPNEYINHSCKENELSDRKGYFVVSIPGLNSWVQQIESTKYATKYNSTSIFENELKSYSIKRNRFDEENNDEKMETNENDTIIKKKLKENESKSEKQSTLSPEYLLNSPIPSRPSKACMIKVYTEDDYELGEVIDVIGFLSMDPSLDGLKGDTDHMDFTFDTQEEIQLLHPPPSLVPRLHAVFVKRLKHFNPFDSCVEELIETDVNAIYKDIVLALSQCLFGDQIAAEYLLCHLISSVYARTEITPLGQFTLNISHIPEQILTNYTTNLYKIIELLLPASHYFPATLENLTTFQFFPKEDPVTNKLVSGHLQLAPHTHFVFDETKLTTGNLGESGLNAIQYLSHVINFQQVKCIFKFFHTDYKCDIPILILSEVKSLLPKNFHIPIKIDFPENIDMIEETLKATEFFLQSKLNTIRQYLTNRRLKKFEMPVEGNMSRVIQDDFVRLRREKSIGTEYLHNLMVLSRLIGLSRGKSELDEEIWKYAIDLENEREHRINLSQQKI